MQPQDFLAALAAVDISRQDNFYDFLDRTLSQPSANLLKLVPIGMHDSVRYFIKVNDKAIRQDTSTMTPANAKDTYYGTSVFEAKSLPAGAPAIIEIRFGFGIGRLWHQGPSAAQPQDTGFYVICSAVDKSIWVAFDFEPYSETGDIHLVMPDQGEEYGKLPEDTQNLVIGIQKLFGKEWTASAKPFSLDGKDPFKNGAGTPLALKLVTKPALVADVLNAIKVGGGAVQGG